MRMPRMMSCFAVVLALATAGCAGTASARRGVVVSQKERCRVMIRVAPEEAMPIAEAMKEGSEKRLERAGSIRTTDRFTYLLQVAFQVETDSRDVQKAFAYFDANARLIRTVDGHIVAQKEFWESHVLKQDGGQSLLGDSRKLGAKIARWAIKNMP